MPTNRIPSQQVLDRTVEVLKLPGHQSTTAHRLARFGLRCSLTVARNALHELERRGLVVQESPVARRYGQTAADPAVWRLKPAVPAGGVT